jgi:predicted Zn-dependent protease
MSLATSMKGLFLLSALGITVSAGAGSPEETKRVWTFHTQDDAATVQTANYFFDAAFVTRFRKGDIIMAVMDVDGTPVFKQYVVTVANSTTCTIVLQTVA